MNRLPPGSALLALLIRRPTMDDAADLLLALAAFGAVASLVGRELLVFGTNPLRPLIASAVVALFTPAIAEEIVFRGLLIRATSRAPALVTLVTSTALFTLWHVFEVMTFLPGARQLFLRGDFLMLAATLGLMCGLLRLRSNGLWTAIALHWVVVVAWMAVFKGPDVASLMN